MRYQVVVLRVPFHEGDEDNEAQDDPCDWNWTARDRQGTR